MAKRGRKSPAELSIVTHDEPAPILDWNPPEPPAHLSESASAWWRAVTLEYVLEAHHLRLLEAACDAWCRMSEARTELSEHGSLTFRDPKGMLRAHPAVAIERDARLAFARLLRELDLDGGSPNQAVRPPALNSNQG